MIQEKNDMMDFTSHHQVLIVISNCKWWGLFYATWLVLSTPGPLGSGVLEIFKYGISYKQT